MTYSPTLRKKQTIITGTGSFAVPNDVSLIDMVEAWGGGAGGAGGGGGAATGATPGGGSGGYGGNGGSYVSMPMRVTPGETLTVTIGGGGSGGNGGAGGNNGVGSDGSEGTDGGDTTVAGALQTVRSPGGWGTAKTSVTTLAYRIGKGGTGSAAGVSGAGSGNDYRPYIPAGFNTSAQSNNLQNQNPGSQGSGLAIAGATNVNGGGGGCGTPGGQAVGAGACKISVLGTVAATTVAATADTYASIPASDVRGLGLCTVAPKGGDGGPGNVGGAGAIGGTGASATGYSGGGGGGGGGGGKTAGGVGGDGGPGGAGTAGLVVLTYWTAS